MQVESDLDTKNPLGGKISKIIEYTSQADEVSSFVRYPKCRVSLKVLGFCRSLILPTMLGHAGISVVHLKNQDWS